MEYFKRQIELWGEEKQNSLKDKSIAIIGSGGLGCSVGISLGSSGIGKVYIVDFDTVSLHNIHRQIAFRLDDEGEPKAEVLKNLIKSRYDGVEVEAFIEGIDEFSKREIDLDLIIDCTDNLPARAKIDEFAKSKNINWIYGSVEEFMGQVCLFDKAVFKSVFNVKDKVPSGVTPPIVMHLASLQSTLALRFLVGLEVKKDLLYYLTFQDGELKTQKFKLPS